MKIADTDLALYAYTNASLLAGKVRAVALSFHGLNHTVLRKEANEEEAALAKAGILTLFPYYGPWSWMNQGAVQLVDAVVEAAWVRFGLGREVPLLSTGGSMGGQGALIYALYAARPVAACAANCPVCDLPYHATEREDLPRTMAVAFGQAPGGVQAGMLAASPLHQAPHMPDIPYLIVHGDADTQVNKQAHSDRLVAALRAAGRRVSYLEVAGMAHCDLANHPDARKAWRGFILKAAGGEPS